MFFLNREVCLKSQSPVTSINCFDACVNFMGGWETPIEIRLECRCLQKYFLIWR